jgi:8-oxo-dGTP pyrophosphatase MutT (NUDIX family)
MAQAMLKDWDWDLDLDLDLVELDGPLLHRLVHPALNSLEGTVLERIAARAIVLDGTDILLLYTRRYNDYSFPGGGLDAGESVQDGLLRELAEETGACKVQVLRHYGYLDELRPHYGAHDLMEMRSHFFVCRAERALGTSALESYEVSNGMEARWIPILQAIAHNTQVMAEQQAAMGLSIHRETLMLRQVAKELLGLG